MKKYILISVLFAFSYSAFAAESNLSGGWLSKVGEHDLNDVQCASQAIFGKVRDKVSDGIDRIKRVDEDDVSEAFSDKAVGAKQVLESKAAALFGDKKNQP